ncbi:hypothetical protein [Empedobacter sp. 189-2]|uniref:hypothetical protein n=1 Tax=Empedobacter sp. 189-2 TaxID=2746724 RepID=UPI002576686B|nr:hypothetical protein [Empedobacter sp. 189-2]MDM1542347.1 hypothetical protein [Empedobacter sp. 189-2]
MNELNKTAHQVAEAKYKLNEDKLLFVIHKEEIITNEVETLLNMGWETSRTSSQQPIEIQNYINNNR